MVITEEDEDGEENKENEDEEKRQRKRRKLTHLKNQKCNYLLVNLIWSLSLSPYGGRRGELGNAAHLRENLFFSKKTIIFKINFKWLCYFIGYYTN